MSSKSDIYLNKQMLSYYSENELKSTNRLTCVSRVRDKFKHKH